MRRLSIILWIVLMTIGAVHIVAQDDIDATAILQITEVEPSVESELGSDDAITIYFDRPLDCETVESALSISPDVEGEFTCVEDGLGIRFTPEESYERGQSYTLTVGESLRGADEAALFAPETFTFNTIGAIQVSEVFPADETTGVSGDTVIGAVFNRPIVALGIVEDMESLPSPLIIEPATEGTGEWVNSSIYTFRPDPAWATSTQYTVTVNDDIESVDGAVMSSPATWTFTTAPAEVVQFMPQAAESDIRLDPRIQITFNTDVDRESFETNFYLRPQSDENGSVTGTFEWSDDPDTGVVGVSFEPDDLLQLNTVYDAGFPAETVFPAVGEAAFLPVNWSFATVPYPAVINTGPRDGETDVQPYGGVQIVFASPMDPNSFEDKIIIEPEPWREPDIFYQTYMDGLSISFPREPSTDYTITLEAGSADVYGNTIDTPFSFSFSTAPYDPAIMLETPGQVGFYNAYREETQLFLTHRNVSYLDLQLYDVPLANFVSAATGEFYYDPVSQFFPEQGNLLRSWRIESVAPLNATRYELLSPGSSVGEEVACAGAIPSRVKVGDTAIVISDPDPLRARSAPVDGEIVELLYRDYSMPIVGGPVCEDGVIWWEVELRDERNVWIAEGIDDEYFIDLRVASGETQVVIPDEFTDGEALRPGVYYLNVQSPETRDAGYRPAEHFMIVSTANLTTKLSDDSVTVWATDVQTGLPIPNAPIQVYDVGFNVVGEGVTDADGIVRIDIPEISDLYQNRAVLLQTDEHFGLNLTHWSEGIDPWRFGQPSQFYSQDYSLYMYTDRPIYRPDQPVYFRGVLRQKDDVTYTQAEFDTVPVEIFDDQGEVIYRKDLPLTEFGTFNDTFELADDAALGFYRINVDLPSRHEYQREGNSVFFNVAEFRLPEFEVNVEAQVTEVVQNDTVAVDVAGRYFFGGNVSDAMVEYNVIANPYNFQYDGPGGRYDFTDFNFDGGPGDFYGSSIGLIASGEGTTDEAGQFTIEFDADLEDATQSQTFTIEATVRDESDQVVAGRTDVIVHQGNVYIGARPENYVSRVGEDTGLEFITVDWDSNPVAEQEIDVQIVERRWSSIQEEDSSGRTVWTWEVEEIDVDSATVTTDEDGQASYNFVPPYGGVFKVIITTMDSDGNAVRASTTLWVSSREYVSWRQQNSNRIDLITDANEYNVGDTAQVLITSPFQGAAEALITVERGDVLSVERVTLDSNSYVYELPITEELAPNAFVNVMIVKGVDENNPIAGFRMGIAEIQVDNSSKELQIDITPDREQAGPGDTVTYTVRTTDHEGTPVRAEVGVGVTDLASLSVADPNTGPILDFFYGLQAIAVRTSTPLTINTDQITQTVLDTIKGGGGGGGEGGIFDIREEFVDTAYWNGSVVTDEDGEATFDVTLPDNLTTWRLDARAATSGGDGLTLVGQDTFDLLSTKPLLIRPVTPRFFVVGDELVLAAIVNNNTDEAQSVEVSIEGTGVAFVDGPAQTVVIPAGGRQRVNWPVTVQNAEAIDLTFFARSENGDYTDASKPPLGRGDDNLLPVYKYEAPEITGTGGLLREAGSRTEGIVLPRRFDVTQGELTINLEPSLAATSLEALDVLRNYPYSSAEVTVSRFLPNIMTFRALNDLGVAKPGLQDQLDHEVQIAIQRLNAWQKVDGGWGWQVQEESNVLVTAYAVIGLVEAQNAGFAVDNGMIERAQGFLTSQFVAVDQSVQNWRLDRQAFVLYALARSGRADVSRTVNLFEARERLSIYAQAFLVLSFDLIGDNEGRIDTLMAEILNEAILSANGVHWEERERDRWNWNTDTRTTSIVLGALVRVRPDSDLIPNVVRWLMVARSAEGWETTQETAWGVMALTDWMVASSELNADYDFTASFNDDELASGSISSPNVTETQQVFVEVADMLADDLNRLTLERTEGVGNLYYTAYLRAYLPVPEIEALNRGIIVQRRYNLLDDEDRESITAARIGDVVQVRLTIIAPNDLHYVVVEDPIPAGTEAINPDLAISQQIGTRPGLEQNDPLSYGWGWWWFSDIEFRDEKVVLSSSYLPAGTYEYVYTIRPGLEGTYNVIPPTGRESFFPDVFGRGDGSTFTVLPVEE